MCGTVSEPQIWPVPSGSPVASCRHTEAFVGTNVHPSITVYWTLASYFCEWRDVRARHVTTMIICQRRRWTAGKYNVSFGSCPIFATIMGLPRHWTSPVCAASPILTDPQWRWHRWRLFVGPPSSYFSIVFQSAIWSAIPSLILSTPWYSFRFTAN